MNEKMLTEQLERDIEHLLDGRALPNDPARSAEYQEALDMAQILAQHDMSNESRIRRSLRQDLLHRISTQRKEWSPQEKGNYAMKPHTKKLLFVAVFTVFLLTAMALPPVRAFAQELLREIGPFVFVSKSEDPWEEPPADFNPTPIPGGTENLTPTPIPAEPNLQTLTPQEAWTKLGFKVLLPSHIPEGYVLSVDPNFIYVVGNRISSSMVYTTAEDDYLGIAQSTFEDARLPFLVEDEKVVELTIHGQEAFFVGEGVPMTVLDENGNNVDIPLNCLMWEEGGHFFMMTASELTQAEMVKIAEALK